MSDAEARIAALEEHARVSALAVAMAVSHIRALAATNGALFALLDEQTRETMRAEVHPVIGSSSEDAQARAMVEALLLDPTPAIEGIAPPADRERLQ